jgi:hypothetical protein
LFSSCSASLIFFNGLKVSGSGSCSKDLGLLTGIEDLRKAEGGTAGYVSFFKHGVIGKGLNDYDAIFSTLKEVGFDSWISIEDGVDGMEQMHESADFLREKIKKYWPNYQPR